MTQWPAPIIRLYLGNTTSGAMFAAADAPEVQNPQDRLCAARFYAGELALRQAAKDEAVRLFRLAAAGCQKDFVEWSAANAELKALGAQQ
jgi:lipoprotein NlpI